MPWQCAIRRISQLVIVVSALSSLSVGQVDKYDAHIGDAQIASLREEMHERMTSQEVALDNSIRYSIVKSNLFNAHPLKQDGRREVIISSALIQAVDELATMETAAFLWERMECLGQFMDYQRNRLIQKDMHSTSTTNPWSFIKSHPSICPKVTPDALYHNERGSGEFREIIIIKSIKWILLHEFAHQLYDDFGEANRKESREREARADNYASLAMLNPPETPILAMYTILLFCYFDEFDLSNSGDHPIGVMRLRAMMDATLSSPQGQAILKLETPVQRQALEEALNQIDKMTDTSPKN
jgi:hypothetical protein